MSERDKIYKLVTEKDNLDRLVTKEDKATLNIMYDNFEKNVDKFIKTNKKLLHKLQLSTPACIIYIICAQIILICLYAYNKIPFGNFMLGYIWSIFILYIDHFGIKQRTLNKHTTFVLQKFEIQKYRETLFPVPKKFKSEINNFHLLVDYVRNGRCDKITYNLE